MTKEQAIEILKTDSCVDCGVGSQSPCTCTFNGHCDIKDAMDIAIKALEQPTQKWIPLVWDEYPTVDSDGNDDYVYAVDYSVPMPKEDEWVLVTDENHNVVKVQYDGYDFGDYARENILAWQPLPKAYEEK